VITSKLTSKSQTTIPQPVLAALGMAEGDELAYTIEAGRVVLTKAPPRRGHPLDDPFVTLTEWHSEADRRAFKNL
jgi:antitoxin PrlF